MKATLDNGFIRLTAENDREISFIHAQSLLVNDANFRHIKQWLFTAEEAVNFLEFIVKEGENVKVTIDDKAEYLTATDEIVFRAGDHKICVKYTGSETRNSKRVFHQIQWILAPDGRFGEYFLWQFESPLDASFNNTLDLVILRRSKSLYLDLLEIFDLAV